MSRDEEGFLGRWARRKAISRKEMPANPPASPAPPDAAASPLPTEAPEAGAALPSRAGQPAPEPRATDAHASPPPLESGAGEAHASSPRLPTLDDLAALTPQSDFSAFMRPGVAQDVKLAALKKLFSDPHHNVMDGLDIYIDDYSSPPVLPASALKKMVSARVLSLIEDEPESATPENLPPAQPAPAPSPEASEASAAPRAEASAPANGGERSMLESETSAEASRNGQMQFDFSAPDGKA